MAIPPGGRRSCPSLPGRGGGRGAGRDSALGDHRGDRGRHPCDRRDPPIGRLLEIYAAAGGANVSVAQVQVHELCLAANWYREALAGRATPPDEAWARFRAVLRRVRASSR